MLLESPNQELFISAKRIRKYKHEIKSKDEKRILKDTIENLLFNKYIYKDENAVKDDNKEILEYAIKDNNNFSN